MDPYTRPRGPRARGAGQDVPPLGGENSGTAPTAPGSAIRRELESPSDRNQGAVTILVSPNRTQQVTRFNNLDDLSAPPPPHAPGLRRSPTYVDSIHLNHIIPPPGIVTSSDGQRISFVDGQVENLRDSEGRITGAIIRPRDPSRGFPSVPPSGLASTSSLSNASTLVGSAARIPAVVVSRPDATGDGAAPTLAPTPAATLVRQDAISVPPSTSAGRSPADGASSISSSAFARSSVGEGATSIPWAASAGISVRNGAVPIPTAVSAGSSIGEHTISTAASYGSSVGESSPAPAFGAQLNPTTPPTPLRSLALRSTPFVTTRTPDRFIPARRGPAATFGERFRTTRNPAELTDAERVNRTDAAGVDPFAPLRQHTAPPLRHQLGGRDRGRGGAQAGPGGLLPPPEFRIFGGMSRTAGQGQPAQLLRDGGNVIPPDAPQHDQENYRWANGTPPLGTVLRAQPGQEERMDGDERLVSRQSSSCLRATVVAASDEAHEAPLLTSLMLTSRALPTIDAACRGQRLDDGRTSPIVYAWRGRR